MFFTRRRAPRFLPNPLILCEQVRWNKPIKYLGMHLDQKLTYQDNVNQNCCKIYQSMHTLYPLIGRRSKFSTQSNLIIFKTIMQPLITYGARALRPTVRGRALKKPPILQNKRLKMIMNKPFYFSICRSTH